jgi:hypothetical protein
MLMRIVSTYSLYCYGFREWVQNGVTIREKAVCTVGIGSTYSRGLC